jgi:hypothetical protein
VQLTACMPVAHDANAAYSPQRPYAKARPSTYPRSRKYSATLAYFTWLGSGQQAPRERVNGTIDTLDAGTL